MTRPLRLGVVAGVAAGALALAAPALAEGCGPVETVPDEGHQHLVEGHDPPVPYGSTPPTSGWHYRAQGTDLVGVHDAPLGEPRQVSVLAADGVVVTYRDLRPDDLDALARYVEGAERAIALTPYEELAPGQVALTAWNRRQVCDGLHLDTVAAFVEAHAAAELDPTMASHDDHEQDPAVGPPADERGVGPVVLVAAVAFAGLAVAGIALGIGARRSSGTDPS